MNWKKITANIGLIGISAWYTNVFTVLFAKLILFLGHRCFPYMHAKFTPSNKTSPCEFHNFVVTCLHFENQSKGSLHYSRNLFPILFCSVWFWQFHVTCPNFENLVQKGSTHGIRFKLIYSSHFEFSTPGDPQFWSEITYNLLRAFYYKHWTKRNSYFAQSD